MRFVFLLFFLPCILSYNIGIVSPGPLVTYIPNYYQQYSQLPLLELNQTLKNINILGPYSDLCTQVGGYSSTLDLIASTTNFMSTTTQNVLVAIAFACVDPLTSGNLAFNTFSVPFITPSARSWALSTDPTLTMTNQLAPSQLIEMHAITTILTTLKIKQNICVMYTNAAEDVSSLSLLQSSISGIVSRQIPDDSETSPALNEVSSLLTSTTCKTMIVLAYKNPLLRIMLALDQLGWMTKQDGGHLCLLKTYAVTTVVKSWASPDWAPLYNLTKGCLGVTFNYSVENLKYADTVYNKYFTGVVPFNDYDRGMWYDTGLLIAEALKIYDLNKTLPFSQLLRQVVVQYGGTTGNNIQIGSNGLRSDNAFLIVNNRGFSSFDEVGVVSSITSNQVTWWLQPLYAGLTPQTPSDVIIKYNYNDVIPWSYSTSPILTFGILCNFAWAILQLILYEQSRYEWYKEQRNTLFNLKQRYFKKYLWIVTTASVVAIGQWVFSIMMISLLSLNMGQWNISIEWSIAALFFGFPLHLLSVWLAVLMRHESQQSKIYITGISLSSSSSNGNEVEESIKKPNRRQVVTMLLSGLLESLGFFIIWSVLFHVAFYNPSIRIENWVGGFVGGLFLLWAVASLAWTLFIVIKTDSNFRWFSPIIMALGTLCFYFISTGYIIYKEALIADDETTAQNNVSNYYISSTIYCSIALGIFVAVAAVSFFANLSALKVTVSSIQTLLTSTQQKLEKKSKQNNLLQRSQQLNHFQMMIIQEILASTGLAHDIYQMPLLTRYLKEVPEEKQENKILTLKTSVTRQEALIKLSENIYDPILFAWCLKDAFLTKNQDSVYCLWNLIKAKETQDQVKSGKMKFDAGWESNELKWIKEAFLNENSLFQLNLSDLALRNARNSTSIQDIYKHLADLLQRLMCQNASLPLYKSDSPIYATSDESLKNYNIGCKIIDAGKYYQTLIKNDHPLPESLNLY